MQTKDHILLCAFKLFLDKGFRNTSMADLVKSAGLSKGAFYHHFNSKETLYQEVIDKYFLAYYAQPSLGKAGLQSVPEVEELIKGFYTVFVPEVISLTDKGLSRYFIIFFEAFGSYPKFKETVRETYREYRVVLTAAFKNDGWKKPELEAVRIIAKYEGLLFWLALYPEEDVLKRIGEI